MHMHNTIVPVAMLSIVMIAGYFMGRRDGLKMYSDLLVKFNNLQQLHNELLRTKWSEPTGDRETIHPPGYWDAEKEFRDN